MAITFPLGAQTSNPFPSPIPTGNVRADVTDFAVIPNSDNQKARVNQLEISPAGRIFVVDQRGPDLLGSTESVAAFR